MARLPVKLFQAPVIDWLGWEVPALGPGAQYVSAAGYLAGRLASQELPVVFRQSFLPGALEAEWLAASRDLVAVAPPLVQVARAGFPDLARPAMTLGRRRRVRQVFRAIGALEFGVSASRSIDARVMAGMALAELSGTLQRATYRLGREAFLLHR